MNAALRTYICLHLVALSYFPHLLLVNLPVSVAHDAAGIPLSGKMSNKYITKIHTWFCLETEEFHPWGCNHRPKLAKSNSHKENDKEKVSTLGKQKSENRYCYSRLVKGEFIFFFFCKIFFLKIFQIYHFINNGCIHRYLELQFCSLPIPEVKWQ